MDRPANGHGAAATTADEAAFSTLAERHRRELQAHCYRMLGSVEDSEDVVQEALLRAWRARGTFQGRASLRAWLYRIATNACLDALQRRRRSESAEATGTHRSPPPPHEELEELAAPGAEPDAEVVSKETVELAFLVAIRHLPPRQRDVLVLRSVLGWHARDAASLLETSVASVNSALQRAHRSLQDHLPGQRLEWSRGSRPSEEERALLARYVEAIERADTDAFLVALQEERATARRAP